MERRAAALHDEAGALFPELQNHRFSELILKGADIHGGALRARDAGVAPRTKQTGGPDQEPRSGQVQPRCNQRLKNVVLQAVEKVRQFGPEELRRTAQALKARGRGGNHAVGLSQNAASGSADMWRA